MTSNLMEGFGRFSLYALVCGAILSSLGAGATAGNDPAAQAALEIWTRRTIKWSVPRETEVTIFQDEATLWRALQDNEVNLAVLGATTFLRIKDTLPVEPFFAPSSQGQAGEEFWMIVHRRSGIPDAAHLKSRRLLYYPRCSAGSPQKLSVRKTLPAALKEKIIAASMKLSSFPGAAGYSTCCAPGPSSALTRPISGASRN